MQTGGKRIKTKNAGDQRRPDNAGGHVVRVAREVTTRVCAARIIWHVESRIHEHPHARLQLLHVGQRAEQCGGRTLERCVTSSIRQLFDIIRAFAASPRTRTRNTPGVGQHHGAEFIGHELYRKMDALFTEQVEKIMQVRLRFTFRSLTTFSI